MNMNRRCWLLLAGLFFFVLTSCGGGGSGRGSEIRLPYTGVETAALLDPSNIVEITEMATSGASGISTYIPDLGGEALSAGTTRALVAISRTVRSSVIAAVIRDRWREEGSCGGEISYDVVVNDSTGEFSAAIVADNYCEDGETLSGDMDVSGQFDSSMNLVSMTVEFGLVSISDAEDDITISGVITEEPRADGYEARLTVNIRENSSLRTYRFEDYILLTNYLGEGFAEKISGRFYHPGYGYVDVSTVLPFVFSWGADAPFGGESVCEGRGGTKSRYRALSAAAYIIDGDLNGDGEFGDFTTAVLHYPGMNTLPVTAAGDDGVGNIGCGDVAISGAAASDADTDPLSITWTFVTRPAGSVAAISGAGTLTPTFVPDLVGQYVLKMTVSDGFGASVEDTVTVSIYGDLFCLNAKIFIPSAQESKPSAVAVGDVTGDGRDDVVFLTASTESVNSDPAQDFHLSVYAQTEQGLLASPRSYPAGDGSSLAIADLNGDGRNDVAVSTRSGIGIFYQNVLGGLATMRPFSFGVTIDPYEPHAVVAADFTGDGRSDLVSVYSDFTAARIRLYAQQESGELGAPALMTTEPGYWVASAVDLDGDQKDDLLLATNTLGKGSIYLGVFARRLMQSGGTLAAPVDYLFDNTLSPYAHCSNSFVMARLNGDDRPDLVTSCQEEPPQTLMPTFLRLYPQQGDGALGAPLAFAAPAGYGRFAAIDLNNDALSDLVASVSGNQMVFDVFRQGSGGPGAAESYPAGLPNYNYSSEAFALGDVNGDGFPDIVTAVFVGMEGGNGLMVLPGNPGRQ